MTDESTPRDRTAAIAVLVATVVTILINGLAAAGYINGVTPDVVSGKYPTVVTPAGYAFSIWSIIYVGLIVFSIYQLLPTNRVALRAVRLPYVASCLLNCSWIYFWHHDQIALCLIVIVLLAVTLGIICKRLKNTSSYAGSLLSKAPFGLYFGWVTCATLINLTIFLGTVGVNVQSRALGVVLILAATAAAVVVRWRLINYFYPLAVAWALTAIAVNQSGNTPIVIAAAFGTVACLVTAGSVVTSLKDSTSE